MNLGIILLNLFLTFIGSFLFGYERQRSHKPVGFGTYTFVAMGSCALGLVSIIVYPESPLSLLGAVVSGIGFLGAGALIKTTDKIFGFTSAASIWVFAIFGLLLGISQYLLAGVLYFLVWAVILFDVHLEKKGIGSYRKKVIIQFHGVDNIKEVENLVPFGIKDYQLISTEINKKEDKCALTFLIEGTKPELTGKIRKLYSKEWCDLISIS